MTFPVDLIPEIPYEFGGHVYTARRNAAQEPDGSWRWQVFRDGMLTPVGFIQSHACPDFDGPRFLVFDAGNRQLSVSKPGRDDGCVGGYETALAWLRLELSR